MLCERDLANIVNILSYSSTVIDLQYFIFIRFNPWGYFLQDFSCHGSMLSVVFLSQKIIPEGQDFCIFELAAWYMILHCKQLIHVVESHAGVDAQTLVSQVLWSHRSSDPTDPALGTEDGWVAVVSRGSGHSSRTLSTAHSKSGELWVQRLEK